MGNEYAELRYLTRSYVGRVWKLVLAGAELEGDEAVLARILKQHPEYSDIWERAADLDPYEEVLLDGANPFAHVTIHQIVENQIAGRTPPQTAETLEALMQAGYTRHEAIHAIGRIVSDEIFEILRDERPFDEAGYVQALRELVQTATGPKKGS